METWKADEERKGLRMLAGGALVLLLPWVGLGVTTLVVRGPISVPPEWLSWILIVGFAAEQFAGLGMIVGAGIMLVSSARR
ncbi:MAG TPA: hypothetical protein VG942_17695 [Hyphomonadaceae bacterium]|nr:hypothetical protein [Hyphomonadaceae bacterium]